MKKMKKFKIDGQEQGPQEEKSSTRQKIQDSRFKRRKST